MSYNPDVLERAGRKVVLLGNEAIARGALEAGVGFSSSYPGTPSSEVGMTLAALAKKCGFYCEWSVNEKVAFEAAAGAAFSGVRSLTAMKHFGMNVAGDSVFPVVYTGVRAGLVLVVADDPGGLSSAQSEQDTRYAARMGNLPVIEPSNVEECLLFAKLAFEMSERYGMPVMLRTTTRVNHALGTVKLGRVGKAKTEGKFEKDYERYYNIPPGLQKLHEEVLEKLKRIEGEYSGKLNFAEGKGELGVIANGVAYEYAKELGLDLRRVKIAKLGLTNPISREFIADFIMGLRAVVVLEELEPILEGFVREVAKEENPKLKIYGKDVLPRVGEYSTDLIRERVAPILGLAKKSFAEQERALAKIRIPTRKPVLCQGCPHRSTFYAVRKALGKDVVWGGDIGCYVLGILDPFRMQDFVISMGASTGIVHGISRVSRQKAVIFIGDSTFFHAGMPGVVNLRYNSDGKKPIIVVLDNSITAMTGHQPHPGSGRNAMGEERPKVAIEEVAKAFGIGDVRVVSAFSQRELQTAVSELAAKNELGVVISRGECRLLTKRKLAAEGRKFVMFEIDPQKCTGCMECVMRFACPAIMKEGERVWIHEELCWGCGVCSQVCPVGAIRAKGAQK